VILITTISSTPQVKYKSNIDYATATELEYGQVVNPAIKPTNAKEFKVETNFSLIVPVFKVHLER
jgi:hypothetical protein